MPDTARLETFRRTLAAASRRVLMLDYDGTLAPFRVERTKAVPYPGVREILDTIMDADHTRLVVISGRAIEEVSALLGLRHPPEIWGSHGIERSFPGGRYEVLEMAEHEIQALIDAEELLIKSPFARFLEKKPGCLALHWRGVPTHTVMEMKEIAAVPWEHLAQKHGLIFAEFDGGMELRNKGRTKGDAVQTVLDEEPPDCVTAYVGDDLTDEDAFRRIGDKGLSVLMRPTYRDTAAEVWLRPPEELLKFLQMWHNPEGNVSWT